MKTHSLMLIIGAVLGATMAIYAAPSLFGASASSTPPACRPSLPGVATQGATTPVVLLWGNSLLFDHSWDSPEFTPVNCARQGMTAAQARPLTSMLPEFHVDAILLAFGSVELVQDATRMPATFPDDMAGIVTQLRLQYPDSTIWVAGVPDTGPDWTYTGSAAVARINAALQTGDDTFYLDLTTILSGDAASPHSYDGVHLTTPGYAAWQASFAAALHQIF